MNSYLLFAGGLIAGFVDSIVGGGGLVTLPLLSIALTPGAHAIGTNKIVGTIGALTAFLVYLRKGHFDWGVSIVFGAWVGIGSALGSRATPWFNPEIFRWLLLAVSPAVLWLVWRKDLWTRKHPGPSRRPTNADPRDWLRFVFDPPLLLAGLASGFYDGFFGPGGGTVMFLSLFFVVRASLLGAIAASKFVNTVSASTALLVYQSGGYVHWSTGAVMASGMLVGAFVGAHAANRRATTLVRPVLVLVVFLLVFKLLIDR